jgi:FixJ family two-component response regulator
MVNHRERCASPIAVAVVAEDAAVRNSLQFSLEVEGFAVQSYADCRALLNEPDVGNYTCLIIDQSMHGLKALDVLAKLRDRNITTPAILTALHPSSGLLKRASDAGAVVVEKPLFGNALIENIHAVITTRLKSD